MSVIKKEGKTEACKLKSRLVLYLYTNSRPKNLNIYENIAIEYQN